MSDLISKQAAIDALEWKWAGKAAIDAIKGLPTIDPVKHGRWVCGCCDQCGYILHSTGLTNYCPNCGAKMDGGEDEAD